jgi:hypothetical protein
MTTSNRSSCLPSIGVEIDGEALQWLAAMAVTVDEVSLDTSGITGRDQHAVPARKNWPALAKSARS